MAAYFVLMQQVDDIDRYRTEYLPGVGPLLEKHGGGSARGRSSRLRRPRVGLRTALS